MPLTLFQMIVAQMPPIQVQVESSTTCQSKTGSQKSANRAGVDKNPHLPTYSKK
jgi:hypothetical protein